MSAMNISPALMSLLGFVLLQTAVVAFALGRLFQRVNAIEKGDDGNAGMGKAVTRLEVQMEHAAAEITGMRRDVHALQRQVANAMPGRASAVYEYPPAGSKPPHE